MEYNDRIYFFVATIFVIIWTALEACGIILVINGTKFNHLLQALCGTIIILLGFIPLIKSVNR